MVEWHQISVVSSDQGSDPVAEVLTKLGAVSVTFKDAAGQPLYEPPPDSHPLWRQTLIVALFEQPLGLEAIRTTVSNALPATPLHDWNIEILPDRAWELEWMDHFRAMQFGKRLWVCPSHQGPPDPEAVNLVLDPGLAFGTGTHPSTALCLGWLAEQDLGGRKVIDYGCGSGILAIAAVLLGAENATAVDIDPQALTATAANAQNNGVGNRIDCRYPGEITGETADILIANILARVLEELAPLLNHLVKPGGKLVLSGLLREQVEGVRYAYRQHFTFAATGMRENWVRLEAVRNS
ncbi:MAG: 50S ribosomal protein L11 methyltransferase [Methylococcaceae bacterium]|nr:50S ribosomal protein L11 methyltransferase [Methylococcaceae bacterium]